MAMATVEEVEILISKLLSEKSKLREDGIKQLLSYLDASGGVSLAPLLDHQTTLYSQPDRMLSSTWPGVVRAVCQCNKAESTSSKKRTPKPIFSKALRSIIQKAEDRIHSGVFLFSPQDLKSLFSHLLEVIVESPSFVTDYSYIIRQLVTVSDYCAQMSRQVYIKLVGFFMERVKMLVLENGSEAALCKEDAFRAASTLYCLLQNPPEDFLVKVREHLIEGFNDIFLHLRDEGRRARKLLASLNLFLLKDGVNLGDVLLDIHSSIKGFILRTWKVTRDRELKDELVFYGRLQLKFRTVILFLEGDFISQMQPLVEKDLDQSCAINFATGSYRFEGGREGKLWTITKGVRHFLDFAASIFIEAHKLTGSRSLAPTKKRKKDDIFSTVSEHLLKGNSLWWGSFCLLVRFYHRAIPRFFLLEWLQSLSGYLERAFTDASSTTSSFEALVWILRCLQELAAVSPFVPARKGEGNIPGHTEKLCRSCWEFVWVTVLHWLPLFSSTSIIVEESFKLLSFLLIQSLLPVYAVPKDFWTFKPLLEPPSGSVLFFLASYFSSAAEQVTVRDDFELWRKLLSNLVASADKQEYLQLKSIAILSLTVGCFLQPSQVSSWQNLTSHTLYELQDWAKPEEDCEEEDMEFDILDELGSFAVDDEHHHIFQDLAAVEMKLDSLPLKHTFVRELADVVSKKAFSLIEGKKQNPLEQLFSFCAVIVSCFIKIGDHLQRRGKGLEEWAPDGQVYHCILGILNHCIHRVEDCIQELSSVSTNVQTSMLRQSISEAFSSETQKSLKELLSLDCLSSLLEAEHCRDLTTITSLIENLLQQIVRLIRSCNELLHTVLNSQDNTIESPPLHHAANVSPEINILDADFDNVKQSGASDLAGCKDANNYRQIFGFNQQWRQNCLSVITAFGQQLPEMTCDVLFELVRTEEDPKVARETLLCLCKCITHKRSNKVPHLVDLIETQKQSSGSMETISHFLLTAANTLLATLLSSEKKYTDYSLADLDAIRRRWNLPEMMFVKLARLLDDVSQKPFLFWRSRGDLVEGVAKLVVLDPTATDALLDRFLRHLGDVDYRVRCIMAKNVKVLFQAYTGHEGLFKDICSTFEIQMVMATNEKIVSASEVSLTSRDRCMAETAVMTLGEVAACSEKVEVEAVFMICANAAIFPSLRSLSRTILDDLARQLNYPNRWKYLSHLLCCIFSFWVKVGLPLPTLVEIRDLLVCSSEPVDFLKYCSSLMLPPLLLYNRDNELTWLAKVLSKPLSTLVKDSSAAIFSSLLPMFCHGSEEDKELARSVLQGKMLAIANLSEDERDILIRKNMISIVNGLLQLCSVADNPHFPLHTKGAIISSLRIVVDGFCGSEFYTSRRGKTCPGVQDVLKIFRADRVVMFILQIHLQLETSFSSRHRRNKLGALECLIDVIQENVKVPNTCRYLFHTVLQSLEQTELHKECCYILSSVVKILSALPKQEYSEVLGPQLQLIVLHLVSACMRLSRGPEEDNVTNSPVFALLKQLTINADSSLYLYIKARLPVLFSVYSFEVIDCVPFLMS
ncbi:hypothetical protein L7F22_017770 [Adiantum nelumboides]|nr:hypothetical protein [Adiantum nelumboides]